MHMQELYGIFRRAGRVTTDSRTISGGELFIALRGENFDGNDYAAAALEKGAVAAVVSADSAAAASGDPRMIPVPDTLAALQDLARTHRRYSGPENGFRPVPVVGLTGTNGKTTTKELITRVLSVKYRVTATRGNLNNDIGVPLTLLDIVPGQTQVAVVEMGASHPDDIGKLVKVSEPDCGLITNVGKAHLLGFGSFDGVKRAKGMLYDYLAAHGGIAFVNEGDPDLKEMASDRKGMTCLPYGLALSGARVIPSDAAHPFLRIAFPHRVLETHLSGAYNATNVMAALAVGEHFGVGLDEALDAVASYVPTNNRSQLERTERNTLIVDAYNANPSSMAAALENLRLADHPHKVALLGEMRELGKESNAEHRAVLRQVLSLGLDRVCLVGEEFGRAAFDEDVLDRVECFLTSVDLADRLAEAPVEGCLVLVKGSRGTMMERVIPKL